MRSKATKRPWKKSVSHGSEGPRIYPDTGDLREAMKFVAMVNGRSHEVDEANADLIIKAVNNHDALVKVAMAFVEEPCKIDPIYKGPNCLCPNCRARAAIEELELKPGR